MRFKTEGGRKQHRGDAHKPTTRTTRREAHHLRRMRCQRERDIPLLLFNLYLRKSIYHCFCYTGNKLCRSQKYLCMYTKEFARPKFWETGCALLSQASARAV